jgi:hypothetical protein
MALSTEQITLGAIAWVDRLRLEWAARYPDGSAVVPAWNTLPAADKAMLFRCMKRAMLAGTPENAQRAILEGRF